MDQQPAPQHETESTPITRRVVAVDLFCGVGGLTHGLRREGIEVVAGYDLDKSCKYAYETNNPGAVFHAADVKDLTVVQLQKHYPEGTVRVLVGCAPCQPYSSAANKHRKALSEEEAKAAWEPLRQFQRLILELRPDVVSMENVTRLGNRDKFPIYAEFIKALEEAGYKVDEYRPYGPDYGIPQARRRLVLFASLHGRVGIIPKTHTKAEYVSTADALKGLKQLSAGATDPDDVIHTTSRLDDINLRRARASKVNGTWADWPPELQLACHKKKSGKTFSAVYGRIDGSKPAPTMTTQFYRIGTGRFVHPEQPRGLSLREGAILQTFPKTYKFVKDGEKPTFTVLGRQIGNAVPPRLGAVVGSSIRKHVAAFLAEEGSHRKKA